MNTEKDLELANWRKQKYEEILAELRTDAVLRQILERAYPTQRESFITEYANQRLDWMEYGAFYAARLAEADLHWTEEANVALAEIQQKKLFDVQCLWRAEQIDLPGVELTVDFQFWEANIMACPFIDPVTEEEVDIYIQYLRSGQFEPVPSYERHWQDHEEICEAYRHDEEFRNVPAWYEFHNGRTGKGVLMTLPDRRGEKEEYYLDLWRKQRAAETGAAKANAQRPDTALPHLNYFGKDWMAWFANTFEDEHTRQQYARFQSLLNTDEPDDSEQLEDELYLMACAEHPVPMQACHDWREGVHRAALAYRAHRIADALPEAHAHYLFTVEMGMSPELNERASIRSEYRQWILQGRKIAGEPQDFDF
jgi:hypothetical protein